MDTRPRIWVDADSCPAAIRKIILKAAVRLQLPVTYVANRKIAFDQESELFQMHICPVEENAADDYIVEQCQPSDIVITRDIPLAERLVRQGITTLNDRGTIFDEKTVTHMLRQRELNLQMSAIGVRIGGRWDSFGPKEIHAFAATFDSVLANLNLC